MKTDIGIWKIDQESLTGRKLDPADRIETEKKLENILVANPNMLMGGLTLVGRQVPVGTGYIDLLGVDEAGRLVVFELKREKLTRDAVAQILDYCTYLETLSDPDLATLIAEQSGKHGIKRIADFEEWYASQAGDALRPVRMVLVGLGTDVSAHRMVAYLAEGGIDIRLLTFHGYMHGDSMLLARQVRTAEDPPYAPAHWAECWRLESEGQRARCCGSLAGCESVAGLQCPNLLHEIRHYVPSADDYSAR